MIETITIDTDQWAVVPKAVTRAMIDAWFETDRLRAGVEYDDFQPPYAAMLAAAPPPEQAQRSDGAVINYGTMVSAEFLTCFDDAFSFLANGHSIGQCFDMMKFAKAELIKSKKNKKAPRPVQTSERARFEAWFASKHEGFCPAAYDGEYDWAEAQSCWESWQEAIGIVCPAEVNP